MATANIKIGPVRLTVDPDQISVVDNKVNTSVPGLRSNTPRTVNTGKSTVAIRMSAIFPNSADINTKLRDIIAYFRAVPFNTIQSDVINRMVATKIVQRTADDDKTTESASKASRRLKRRFKQNVVNLIANTLVDQIVKDYFTSKGWSLPDAILNYVGRMESDLDSDVDRLADDSIIRTLSSKFIELNYAISKVERSKIGNTPAEQIDILRSDLRKIIAETASDDEVETRAQSISEGIKQLTSFSQIEDGDTIIVDGITYRFLGVDAFETLRPGSSSGPGQDRPNGDEKFYAERAKTVLQQIFFAGPGATNPNRFQLTVKGSDNYGRKLAEINMVDVPGFMPYPNVSEYMVEYGLGVPSAISAAGRYMTVEDVPYVEKGIFAHDAGAGIWANQGDIQLPSLWRGFAKNTNNFDPDNPNYLRSNILSTTLRAKTDLKALMDSLVEEFKGLVGNKRDDFVPRALGLVTDYNAAKDAAASFSDIVKGVGVEAIGFPDNIVPVAFAGINYIATPQLPDSIQAEFTFFLFNHHPYMPRLMFLADKFQNSENETEYTVDPDIAYSRPLADRVRKEYTGDEALHSPDYLTRYQGELNLSINYSEIILEEFSRGITNRELIDDKYLPPTQITKSRKLNDRVLRPVFRNKVIHISPDDDPVPIRVSGSEGNKDVLTLSDLQLESVAVNLTNNVIAIPIEASPIPTVQHMGKGVSTVMLEFTTRNMDTVIAFRTVDSTIQESAKLARQHKIPTSFTVRNTTINMGGARDFVFENIIISTDANIPDKYNIKLVMTESTNTEVSATERLIPQFQQEFANPGMAIDRILKILKDEPNHPFIEEMLGTFLPATEGDRARKFPLPLIFAHTRRDDIDQYVNSNLVDILIDHKAMGNNRNFLERLKPRTGKDENKQLVDEFLQLLTLPENTNLNNLLTDAIKLIDTVWTRNPRSDTREINSKFRKAQYDNDETIRNVVGPWGFGPGSLFNNTDALSDRWSRYIVDSGTSATIVSKTLDVVAGVLSDKPERNRNYGQKLGIHAHNMGKIIRSAYEKGQLSRPLFIALLKSMFKEALDNSKEFENFLAGWISFQVGIYGDLIKDIAPPNIEAVAYRDLKLPSYRDLYSSSNVVLKQKRKELIGHMRAMLAKSTWIISTLDTLALEQSITIAPDKFRDMANRTIFNIQLGLVEPTAADLLAITRLQESVSDLFDQETNKAGTAGSSRFGGPVSENSFPTYRDLGITTPAGAKETDPARVADDFVEPGWMYGTGYLNTWDELSRTTDLQAVFKSIYGKEEQVKKFVDPNTVIADRSEKANGEMLSDKEDSDEADNQTPANSEQGTPRSRQAAVKGKEIAAYNKNKKKKLNEALDPDQQQANVQWKKIDKSEKTNHTASTDAHKDFFYKSMGRLTSADKDINSIKHAQAAFKNIGQGKEVSSMRNAYPGYAIYFLEEDAEDWGYLDDYYRYDAVISWDVVQAKDIPDVATIRFINYKGALTNEKTEYDVGSIEDTKGLDATVKSTLETIDPRYGNKKRGQFGRNDEYVVTAFKLRPGTRIVIKAGYSTKVEEMETLFTGQVAECMPGDITTVICQSYVTQLMGTMNASWNRNKDNFPEIVQEMLRDTTYFGRWERFVTRQKGQNKVFNGSWYQKIGSYYTRAQYGKNIGELFPDTSDDNIYIRNKESNIWDYFVNWIRDDGWQVKGPVWYNMLTMPRYLPNTVVASRPYDGRATLFFGSPDGFYIHTNRYPGNPRFWKSEALKEVFRGGIKNGDKSYNNIVRGLMGAQSVRSESSYVMVDKDGEALDVKEYANTLYGHNNYVGLHERVNELPKTLVQALFSIWIKRFYSLKVTSDQEDTGKLGARTGKFVLIEPRIPDISFKEGKGGTLRLNKISSTRYDTNTKVVGVSQTLEATVSGLATYLNVFQDPKKDSKTGAKIVDFVLEKSKELIGKISDEYSDISAPSATPKNYHTLRTIINRLVASGTANPSPRNNVRRLRAGYIVASIDKKIDSVFNVNVRMGRHILTRFLHEFVPMLYGVRNWARSHPGSVVADLIQLGDELDTIKIAPNERPFRESHLALSGYNIVRNGIVASMAHSANIVTITNGDDKATESMPVTDSLVSKHPKLVYDINAIGGARKPIKTQAVMSALGEELRKMYRGQLTLLGNPKIRPHHIVRVDDHYNVMYGPIEADRVIHSFNQQTGYTTSVVPHMIVRVAEDLGYTDAIIHNFTAGFRTMSWLGASVAGALALKGTAAGATALLATGPPGWIVGAIIVAVGLGVGAYLGGRDAYNNVLEGNQESWFLGIPFPSLSSQGRYDESRLNPVQIMPLAYRGAPYTVGLDGWDPSTWTLAKAKQYRTQALEIGLDKTADQFREAGLLANEAINAISENASQATGEINFIRRR